MIAVPCDGMGASSISHHRGRRAAAKAAVEQFARPLAVEVAPDHIRVNNVVPDYTSTPNMARTALTDAPEPPFGHRTSIPMRRLGALEDVSGCVVFLASALSSFVTGQTLHRDGGAWASSGWFNWPEFGWSNRRTAGRPEADRRLGGVNGLSSAGRSYPGR